MSSHWNKFYIIGAAGGETPLAEDLYYHWGVVHTALFLATNSPIENFVRYAQNYANPDVPDDARLIRRCPTTRYRMLSDHWANTWKNVENSVEDPSHRNRMGRHRFGDVSTMQFFFGSGGPVHRSPSFQHPAGLTIAHWLGLPKDVSRSESIAKLAKHQQLVISALEKQGGSCKYTVDVCNDEFKDQVEAGIFKSFPRFDFFAVELLQFGTKEEAFSFTKSFKEELRESYASFINLETSHSLYAVERIVLDFTDENPSTKMPLPVFFTNTNSCEYKMQNNDWRAHEPSFTMLEGTEWEASATTLERERGTYVKTLEAKEDWN